MSISRSTPLAAALVLATLAGSVRGDDVAAGIATRLRDSGALQGYRVNVKAKSGTVWLEGTVSDERQLAAALQIAEESPGVERVVNRLAISDGTAPQATPFSMPGSILALAGGTAAAEPADAENAVVVPEAAPQAEEQGVTLVQATAPARRTTRPQAAAPRATRPQAAAPRTSRPQAAAPQTRRPAMPVGRPAQPAPRQRSPRGIVQVGGMVDEPMTLPMPDGYAGEMAGERIVPGTMQYGDVPPGMAGGPPGMGMGGAPMPMGGTGVGMPPVPMRGDGPNMPNYAWPSYAAYPNYAALQYPTQYSPTAWPYIGPFYPYPQVPLGWRRVSLEWDDGWWWLDFDERHMHSHHR